MKTIIALLCTVALASCVTYTLSTDNSITVSVGLTANTANSSNMDVAWMMDYPDTLPTEVAAATHPVICFDSAASNYSIANSATGLSTVAVSWSCATGTGNCDALAEYDATFQQSAGTAGATTSAGAFNSGAMTANTGTFTATSNATTQVITRTITAVTPAAMTSAGLPNSSSTYYLRCFGKLGAATTANIVTGLNDVAATLTAASNVTIKGSASSVAAILAVAGSLAASFAF